LQALAEQIRAPLQTWAPGATQLPALQVLCPTRLVPEQIGPAQTEVGKAQVPPDPQDPAQLPEPPQAGWLLWGAPPAARLVQVPWRPVRSQATQEPVQAVLQQ
jgi:hypothetical protein